MLYDLTDKISLIFSRKNRGKSWLARWLVDESRSQFHSILVIAPSDLRFFWTGVAGESAVHQDYDEGLITSLIQHQRKRGKDGTLNADTKKILVVFDDVLSEVNWKKRGPLLTLATSNRHYGIAILVISQSVSALPPVLRTNADYAFMLRVNSEGSRDLLYADYGTGNKRSWMEALDSATKGYSAYVYDQQNDSYSEVVAEDVPNSYRVPSRSRTTPQCCLKEGPVS